MSEKKEIRKAELLELLEKCPTDQDDTDYAYQESKYAVWKKEVREELNNLLEVYETDTSDRFEELDDKIKELQAELADHKHLPNGEAVTRL